MGKILKIREIGDPVLSKKSSEIDVRNINSEVIDIIEDLKATLEFGTGLGIAAPQIGINKRIIVIGAKKENIKYNDSEEIPITVKKVKYADKGIQSIMAQCAAKCKQILA